MIALLPRHALTALSALTLVTLLGCGGSDPAGTGGTGGTGTTTTPMGPEAIATLPAGSAPYNIKLDATPKKKFAVRSMDSDGSTM